MHLNELFPDGARGTFPGFVYQLGNLFASVNATLQAGLAAHFGGDYGIALVLVAGTVAVLIAILTALGREARNVSFEGVPIAYGRVAPFPGDADDQAPLPPFSQDTAVEKVRLEEDGWNSRNPGAISVAYRRGDRRNADADGALRSARRFGPRSSQAPPFDATGSRPKGPARNVAGREPLTIASLKRPGMKSITLRHFRSGESADNVASAA